MPEHFKISFVRHGEHHNGQRNPGLTIRGIEEGRILNSLIQPEVARTIGVGFSARRSMATLALSLNPDLRDQDIDEAAFKLLANRTLRVSNDLSYLTSPHEAFKSSIDAASSKGEGLAFLVGESDKFLNESPHEISTLSRTSFQVARFLDGYIKQTRNRDSTPADMIVCAREFVYPSFRAKLIADIEGERAAREYAKWYGSNKELVNSVRLDVAALSVDGSGAISIEDSYSSIETDSDVLDDIQRAYLKRVNDKAA